MRQAGRYLPEYRKLRQQAGSFLDLVYTPELAAEVTLQPIRRFGMSAAILFSDILVVPDALGQDVRFKEGCGPILEPLREIEDIQTLSVGRIRDHLAPVFETIRRVRNGLPADTALIGFAGAPWTVATYMIEGGSSPDHALTKRWAHKAPESFAELIDVLVEATVEYLVAQVEAGAEALQLFDSWAGSLAREDLRTWVYGPTRRIVSALREKAPDIPMIGFPKGIGTAVIDFCSATGVQAISLGSDVVPGWAKEHIPAGVIVQGNLDPGLLKAGGTQMVEASRKILEQLQGRPHVFNLGHGITPDIDPAEIALLSSFLKSWKRGVSE